MHNRLMLNIAFCGLLNVTHMIITMEQNKTTPSPENPHIIGYFTQNPESYKCYKGICGENLANNRYKIVYGDDTNTQREVIFRLSEKSEEYTKETSYVTIVKNTGTIEKYVIYLEKK